MNTAALKTAKFWIAAVVALIGVALSQHLVVDGGTLATLLGWAATFLGTGTAGHQIASTSAAQQ